MQLTKGEVETHNWIDRSRLSQNWKTNLKKACTSCIYERNDWGTDESDVQTFVTILCEILFVIVVKYFM